MREQIGAAGPGERLRLESELAQRRADAIRVFAQRQVAELALRQILNRPLAEEFLTPEAGLQGRELMGGVLGAEYLGDLGRFVALAEFLTAEAVATAPEVRALDEAVAAQDRLLGSRGRAYFLPTLALQAQVGANLAKGGAGSALPDGVTSPVTDLPWSVGVSASLPLFQGASRSALEHQAARDLARLQLQRDLVVQRIEQSVRTELQFALSSYAVAEHDHRRDKHAERAAMAAASIPLTPAVHQMADFGPVEILHGTGSEIGYPIVRDMDSFMYERQSNGTMEVGSYAHRPILMHPDDIPSVAEAERSPTELPFTPGDFAPQLERAREIMGELLSGTEMQYAVNGLLSLTPDTQQVLGETAEVANLWSAAAVWVREGPGSARLVAEWMTHGYPRLLDPHGSDVTRFQPHERTGHHVRARCREHFPKTYGIVHPREQWESERGMNRSPFHPRTEALGAEYFEARGWERPQWYASNEDLVARYRVPDRPHEWDRRWWSPIINAEHLHLREKVGVVDLGAFQIFDVSGPGVVAYLESMTVNECDRPVGSSIYTPLLTPDGGFRADLTIQRLAPDRFRIVTGVFDGARDAFWFRKHLPADGSVQFQDRSSAICTFGVWGPHAHALLSKVADCGLSQEELPYGTARNVLIDGIPATMLRISYVGEGGWEIYTRTEHGLALWDAVREAGQDFDARPVGIGVYGTTGRMEKGYLLMGSELTSEYSPVEAGLARRGVKRAEFIGKAAYLKARARGPAAKICTLTMDDHNSASGLARFPTGGNEPVLTLEGDRIVDALGRESRVTSAGMGPSVGKYLLMAYLPTDRARVGERLQVMYMNECFPVTVPAVGGALFDPAGSRMKG